MATFILVHGAWHGSWCWQRVRQRLQAAGHSVFTPTLSGLADRAHLLSPAIGYETHVADIIGLIEFEDLSDIVLVGHSYGGTIIRVVADRIPGKIRSLVFVDAFVPENGKALNDYAPEFAEAFRAQALEVGQGYLIPPIPPEVFNLNAADHALYRAKTTMQPLSTFEQPFAINSPDLSVATVSYIFARDFAASPFGPFRDAAIARGWHTVELGGGHDLMLDQPDALTEELLKAI
jgi:pimeloyl-ACP methyl ester carboxylesterase